MLTTKAIMCIIASYNQLSLIHFKLSVPATTLKGHVRTPLLFPRKQTEWLISNKQSSRRQPSRNLPDASPQLLLEMACHGCRSKWWLYKTAFSSFTSPWQLMRRNHLTPSLSTVSLYTFLDFSTPPLAQKNWSPPLHYIVVVVAVSLLLHLLLKRWCVHYKPRQMKPLDDDDFHCTYFKKKVSSSTSVMAFDVFSKWRTCSKIEGLLMQLRQMMLQRPENGEMVHLPPSLAPQKNNSCYAHPTWFA